MKRFSYGLVLGKFYPLHAGHEHLIAAAASGCDRVTVQALAASVESIPLAVRLSWVRERFGMLNVVGGLDDEPVDFDSESAWDAHERIIRSLLDAPVDAVFTSDAYGGELARRLGAQWVQVDPGRRGLAVSGTAVRADVAGHWWALSPAVRAWFARRVVVLGAESTGTTTLAHALASHFETVWVPEFGRQWTIERPGGPNAPWHTAEFDLVALEHQRAEVEALRAAPIPLVISDTDVLATTVWHERYVGRPSPSVEARARTWRPDLYLLTGDDIPFTQDGLRDGEHLRHAMQGRFREVLTAQPVPWVEVGGTHQQRLAAAVRAVDALLAQGWRLAAPLG